MKIEDCIKELKEEAKKLPLSSIIKSLDLDEIGREVARKKNYRFEWGTPISFSIRPITSSFDILAYRNKTNLIRRGFEIRKYTGKSAIIFYYSLFKKIEKAIEDYANEVPF